MPSSPTSAPPASCPPAERWLVGADGGVMAFDSSVLLLGGVGDSRLPGGAGGGDRPQTWPRRRRRVRI